MSSNTSFLLALEDLTVSFDGFKAVDGLNLYIEKDELRVIIGPNGAGKTTVLDMICGKTRPTEGSIKFKNEEMIGLPEHRDRPQRRRPQVPNAVHIREPDGFRESRSLVSQGPERAGLRRFQAE